MRIIVAGKEDSYGLFSSREGIIASEPSRILKRSAVAFAGMDFSFDIVHPFWVACVLCVLVGGGSCTCHSECVEVKG